MVELWRSEPYPGTLRCGFPDHEPSSESEWVGLTQVLIPASEAETSGEAMHLLRELAEEDWTMTDAAQVMVSGPYWYTPDPAGWWVRQLGRTGSDEETLFYAGQVEVAAP